MSALAYISCIRYTRQDVGNSLDNAIFCHNSIIHLLAYKYCITDHVYNETPYIIACLSTPSIFSLLKWYRQLAIRSRAV